MNLKSVVGSLFREMAKEPSAEDKAFPTKRKESEALEPTNEQRESSLPQLLKISHQTFLHPLGIVCVRV